MNRLAEIAPELVEFARMISGDGSQVHYEVDGTAIGTKLIYEPSIAVQRVFLSAGTEFPLHCHKGREIMTVYSGQLLVFFDGQCQELNASDSINMGPGKEHYERAVEDTWLIAITAPAAEGYPK